MRLRGGGYANALRKPYRRWRRSAGECVVGIDGLDAGGRAHGVKSPSSEGETENYSGPFWSAPR